MEKKIAQAVEKHEKQNEKLTKAEKELRIHSGKYFHTEKARSEWTARSKYDFSIELFAKETPNKFREIINTYKEKGFYRTLDLFWNDFTAQATDYLNWEIENMAKVHFQEQATKKFKEFTKKKGEESLANLEKQMVLTKETQLLEVDGKEREMTKLTRPLSVLLFLETDTDSENGLTGRAFYLAPAEIIGVQTGGDDPRKTFFFGHDPYPIVVRFTKNFMALVKTPKTLLEIPKDTLLFLTFDRFGFRYENDQDQNIKISLLLEPNPFLYLQNPPQQRPTHAEKSLETLAKSFPRLQYSLNALTPMILSFAFPE